MMFDYQDGFVHFLLADEGKYTLPSLRQVSLSEYLDFLLSERQYRSLWVAEGMGPYGLTAYGREAVSTLENSVSKWWGHTFAVVEKNHSGLCGSVQLSAADFFRVIGKLMNGRDGALILPLETLSKLTRQDSNQVSQLIGNEAAYRSRRNILILRGVTPANENMRCFWNPPFTRLPDGSCLLPELTQILEHSERIPFYIHLKHSLGNRFQIFQFLDSHTIELLLRRVMLLHPDRVLPETEIRDLTALIHTELYGSGVSNPVFRELCTREELERKLSEIHTWNALRSELAYFQTHAEGQPVSEYLQSHYPVSPDAALKHTMVQDPVTKNFQYLRIPQNYPKEHEVFCQKFNQMEKFYSIVWNVPCPDCVQAKILSAIQYLRTGLESNFFPLADKCVELITTYVRPHTLEADALLEVYDKINLVLELQKKILELDSQIQSEQSDQWMRKKNLSDWVERARAMNRPDDALLVRIDRAREEVKLKKKLILRLGQFATEYKNSIFTLEQGILMDVTVLKARDDHTVLEIQEKLEENNRTLSRMIRDNDLCELTTSEPKHIREEVQYTDEEIKAELLEIQKELGTLTI